MPWGGWRRGRMWPFGLMTVMLWLAVSPSRADAVPDYQVKAYLMVNLARLVTFPSNSFSRSDSPFVVCLMGEHPFGDTLHKIAKKQQIQGRRVYVQTVGESSQLGGCHALFISRSEDKRLDKVLLQTASLPMLTFSDSLGFGSRGVLINFFRDRDYVRFEINVRALGKTGLTFPSTVLSNSRVRVLDKRP